MQVLRQYIYQNLCLTFVIKKTIFDIIGENGFVAVPTFTLNFPKNREFDVENTPSEQMGIFSEFIRKHEGSKRTYHPIHSISLLGKNSNHIASLKGDTEFSEGSSFDHLLKINCKILSLKYFSVFDISFSFNQCLL